MTLSRATYIVAKSFYMLLPKVIREQYRDSALYFLDLTRKVKFKFNNCKYYIVNSIDELEIPYKILQSIKNRASVLGTQTLANTDGSITKLREVESAVLDLNLWFFEEINLLGGTDALVNKNRLYHQELLAMEECHDLKRHDVFFYFDKKIKQELFLNSSNTIVLKEEDTIYISLLKEHSCNYYHWMTEIMPRAIFTCNELVKKEHLKFIENKKLIFLIDEFIPNQCLEALHYCIDLKFSTKVIVKNELAKCTNVIYCTPFWQSLDNTTGDTLNYSEFFIDKYALELVHNTIFKKLNIDKNEEPFKKIYLQRKPSQMRSIINNQQVENYMIKEGYELVDTSTLSFIEQLQLFSRAKIVIGASGATFTNLLYMQTDTIAINFYPSHPATNHGIFQPLADISGVNLIHFKTIPIDDKSIHSNFMVDLNIIQNILKDFDI